ncbi:MAG: epoxyqueuosine reductase QueH [Deferribacteres bacterium]|nr:epoxyqueuosine reductase QueH [Deferribacteres bacterium]
MKILLHICCSNCALYPFRILKSEGHAITGFWYNPNIHPADEYNLRLESLRRLSGEWKLDVVYPEEYKPEEYFSMFESSHPPESPGRCRSCYRLRLEKTARQARQHGFEAFSTTLLISPYQDFQQITATGRELAEKYNVLFHLKDYRPYFRDAMNLSKELGLYRQKYCGCIFSRDERNRKKVQ